MNEINVNVLFKDCDTVWISIETNVLNLEIDITNFDSNLVKDLIIPQIELLNCMDCNTYDLMFYVNELLQNCENYLENM